MTKRKDINVSAQDNERKSQQTAAREGIRSVRPLGSAVTAAVPYEEMSGRQMQERLETCSGNLHLRGRPESQRQAQALCM